MSKTNEERLFDALKAEDNHTVHDLLAQKGINVNAQNKDGNTALMQAASKGHIGIVSALLAKSADVNAQNIFGKTALMWAVQNNHIEIAKLLLDKDADVHAKNQDDDTALIWALHCDHRNIVDVLLGAGATLPNNKNNVEARRLLEAHYIRAQAGLMLLGAGLVGVGLMFGLGYVFPALGFGVKVTVSLASAGTVLFVGFGIGDAQAAHKMQVHTSASPTRTDEVFSAERSVDVRADNDQSPSETSENRQRSKLM